MFGCAVLAGWLLVHVVCDYACSGCIVVVLWFACILCYGWCLCLRADLLWLWLAVVCLFLVFDFCLLCWVALFCY